MGYGYNPIVGENWRYNPDKTFKISRSKIELFFNCATCFYKDAKLGLRKPPMPGWAINSAVDDLLKKEMDFCRAQDRPHGIFKENGLNIKPFQHEDIEKWQHTFTGIQYHDEEHDFLLYGGVDDIMIDENGKLVVKMLRRFAKERDNLSKKDKIKVLKTIIAILENGQLSNGDIQLPKALHEYMGADKISKD